MIVFPLNLSIIQERPTSFPAPKGIIVISSAPRPSPTVLFIPAATPGPGVALILPKDIHFMRAATNLKMDELDVLRI